MPEIVVHESRFWVWLNRIAIPIGTLALIIAFVQSFGVSIPGASILTAPPGWSGRIVLLLILAVWVRSCLGILKQARSDGIALIVNADGVQAPGVKSLRWSELSMVSDSYGWAIFRSESHPQNQFQIWVMGINQAEWRTAKSEIDRRLKAKN